MPFPNEHSLRIISPSEFDPKSFRRKNITPGIDIIMGKLKGENGAMVAQTYRFKASKFSFEEAKEWMKNHNEKYVSAEKAVGGNDNSDSMDYVTDNMMKTDSIDKPSGQYRFDIFNLPSNDDNDWMQEKMQKKPEGYLKGRAIATNVGVFSYTRPDGKTIRELRPPEEVFNCESMDSMRMIPITNDHPADLLDCENIKDHQVGHTGDDVRKDDYHLSVPVMVTDGKTVTDVLAGKRALSCGYKVDIDETPGNWMGVDYDAVQRNIRYNHLAIVDKARAGDHAKLKMDSAICFDSYKFIQKNSQEDKMKIVKLDGIEYQDEGKLQTAIDAIVEKAKTDVSTLQAKLDSSNDIMKKKDDEIKVANDSLQGKIDEAVKARVDLMEKAIELKIEVKPEMKNDEIKKSIILKAFPNAKEKIDKADAPYLAARYDAAIEILTDTSKVNQDNKEQLGDLTHEEVNCDTVNSDTAREKMVWYMKHPGKEYPAKK